MPTANFWCIKIAKTFETLKSDSIVKPRLPSSLEKQSKASGINFQIMSFRNQYIQNILVYNQYELFCTSVLTSPIAVAWHVHHSQWWSRARDSQICCLNTLVPEPEETWEYCRSREVSESFYLPGLFWICVYDPPRWGLPVLEGKNFLSRNTEKNWGEGPCWVPAPCSDYQSVFHSPLWDSIIFLHTIHLIRLNIKNTQNAFWGR